MKYLFSLIAIIMAMSAWVRSAQASFIVHKSNALGLSNGLVGWWTFEAKHMAGDPSSASARTAYDMSGQGNNGKYWNATGTPPAIGKLGQGLNFDATDDDVSIPQSSSLNNLDTFTISMWVYPRSAGQNNIGRLIDKSASGAGGFKVYMASDMSITFQADRWDGTNGAWSSTQTLNRGSWWHVVITYDYSSLGNDAHFFVNNVLDTTPGKTAPTGNKGSETENLHIGNRDSSVGGRAFDGTIDDVRIYNRVLSPDEIKRLYTMGGTLKLGTTRADNSLAQGLVGWWTFDGKDMAGNSTAGEYAFDKSGNGNRGTLTNGPVRTIGKLGQGLSFDGVDDYVEATDATSLEPSNITIAAWIKTSRVRAEYIVGKIDIGCPPCPGYALTTNSSGTSGTTTDGDLGFWVGDFDNWTSVSLGAGTISDGKWHHVVASYDGTTARIYFDNVQRTSAARTGSIPNAINLQIGRHALNSTSFDGLIDDVRIYNRALSTDEIKRLYNMGR